MVLRSLIKRRVGRSETETHHTTLLIKENGGFPLRSYPPYVHSSRFHRLYRGEIETRGEKTTVEIP